MSVRKWAAIGGLVMAAKASALQPLDEFLRGARSANPDLAESHAARRQAGAEKDVALGRALPRLSLRGTYTRNEFESVIQLGSTPVTITPREQLDGTATLDVPLVDLSSFQRIGAARTLSRAAASQEAATDLRVQAVVSQGYYQLTANVALVEASRRALDVARASLRTAEERHRAGSGALLDVDRARAEVERNVQQLASSELQVALAARALQSLSGVAPALDGVAALGDDLHEEPPLEQFQPGDEALPPLAAAIDARIAAEQQSRAQRLALVPSLSASATEHTTDAQGLVGRDAYWQAVVALNWSFDLTTLAGIRAQDAAAAGGARGSSARASPCATTSTAPG